jgi:sugar/nucleoside kinase (ribokinase family)
MLRFGCAQAVVDRIDPLVNPGQAPSPHMHQVVGGNAFNVSMASKDISQLASCTTCGYSEDVSPFNASFGRQDAVDTDLLHTAQ